MRRTTRTAPCSCEPGQEGYTVLGQWYGEFKFTDKLSGAIGAKEYNTPYINKNDVRMTPNTFEGATLYGTAGGTDGSPEWRYGGGYIAKIKARNSDEFVWMSEAAGAPVDRGVSVIGANMKQGDFSIGAAEYYSDDIINIFYAESKFGVPLNDKNRLNFGVQYSDQQKHGRRSVDRIIVFHRPVGPQGRADSRPDAVDHGLHGYRERQQHAQSMERLSGLHERAGAGLQSRAANRQSCSEQPMIFPASARPAGALTCCTCMATA